MEGLPERPARSEPRIDIACAEFFRPVQVTLLSARFVLRLKHFDMLTKRPYPCPQPGSCPACKEEMFSYLTGWVDAVDSRTARLWILQLSESALLELREAGKRAIIGRRRKVRTTRQDARRNAKMHAEDLGHDDREWVPASFDPRPRLEQIWGLAAARQLRAAELDSEQMERVLQRLKGGR